MWAITLGCSFVHHNNNYWNFSNVLPLALSTKYLHKIVHDRKSKWYDNFLLLKSFYRPYTVSSFSCGRYPSPPHSHWSLGSPCSWPSTPRATGHHFSNRLLVRCMSSPSLSLCKYKLLSISYLQSWQPFSYFRMGMQIAPSHSDQNGSLSQLGSINVTWRRPVSNLFYSLILCSII